MEKRLVYFLLQIQIISLHCTHSWRETEKVSFLPFAVNVKLNSLYSCFRRLGVAGGICRGGVGGASITGRASPWVGQTFFVQNKRQIPKSRRSGFIDMPVCLQIHK